MTISLGIQGRWQVGRALGTRVGHERNEEEGIDRTHPRTGIPTRQGPRLPTGAPGAATEAGGDGSPGCWEPPKPNDDQAAEK